jgi:hypothetical protein
MTGAEWRAVVGWEGHYEVSSEGQIRSVDHFTTVAAKGRMGEFTRHHKGRLLKTLLNKEGYLQVGVSGGKLIRVHRAVAEAFHGPANGLFACHNNGNPVDNRASNLRWGTQSSNLHDAIEHGHHHMVNKTHCPQGHAYDSANTYITPQGHRKCRACGLLRNAARAGVVSKQRKAARRARRA